jgi:murein DD-endopeptidase MepM/ murein hydrolase activator NlpD
MKRTAIILLFIFSCAAAAGAAEKIFPDTSNFQEFKGKVGRWVLMTSQYSIPTTAREFGTSVEDIYAVNGLAANAVIGNEYLFVPYTQAFIDLLKTRNIVRSGIETTDDEFIWPVEQVVNISSVLGVRGGFFHTGIDIPAGTASPVRASMGGRVIYSNYMGGYGHTIEIEHRNNFITRYAHNSVNLVKVGEFVRKGQIIGYVGSTGMSTGNHLHFEIRCVNIPLDPLDFLPENETVKLIHTIKNWK